MSDTQPTVENKADASAEKAYAQAAETTPAKAGEVSTSEPAKSAAPEDAPVSGRGRGKAADKSVAAEPAIAAPRRKPGRPAKVAAAVPAAPKVPDTVAAKAPEKKIAPKIPEAKVSTARPVAVTPAKTTAIPTASQLKDKTMSSNYTDGIKTVVSDAQEKAKEVYSKGAAFAGEYGEFAKGNIEAAIASTRIFAAGLKDLGDTLIADTKEAVETASADFKSLSAVKSPSEFLQFQSDLLQRNIDKAVAYNSKAAESLLKLTNEAVAPVSERFSLAVEKIRKAA